MLSRRILVVAVLISALALAPSVALAQPAPPPIHYVYDELNRLLAVIDRDNNAAAYVYDAVGNILAIERFNAADIPGDFGITFVAPGKGKVGTKVVIYGKGFGTSSAAVGVSFNGTAASVDALGGNRISTSVPGGATTGPVVVTVAGRSATSPKPFKVLGPITIDPASALVTPNSTRQFTATYAGGAVASVLWLVNDVAAATRPTARSRRKGSTSRPRRSRSRGT
jgi:YD repeat-containing protein